MTLDLTTASKKFTGNGANTTFALGFPVLDSGDLVVTRYNPTTDTEITLTEDVHYTVSGVGITTTATVTYPISGTALETDHLLRVERKTTRTQTLDIWNGAAFLPESVEAALDKIYMIGQEIADGQARSLKVPVGENGYTLGDESERSGKVLGFGVSGAPLLLEPSSLNVADFVDSLVLDYPATGDKNSITILGDGRNAAGGPRAIEIRYATGAEEEADSMVLFQKLFQATGTPVDGVAKLMELSCQQQTYNEQNIWALGIYGKQISPNGGNMVTLTLAPTRSLEWTGTEWEDTSITGHMWGIHVPIADQIRYDDLGIRPCPLVNEWSAGVFDHDVPDNRTLRTIAQANAGATKIAPYGLGALGNRSLHTMTAWGWNADSQIGVGIVIKNNNVGGGVGNRTYTDPSTGTVYSDDYGTFRYGLVIDDMEGRSTGNPSVIGVGLRVSNGGESAIEIYSDTDYGLRVTGQHGTGIQVATTADVGIGMASGTFTNNLAISLGDDMRISLSDDNTKFMRWNSSNDRIEFMDGGVVRGYIDMAVGSGVKMN